LFTVNGMNDTPGKLFGLLCVLGGVWIAVYWLWEPAGPSTTLDSRPPDSTLVSEPPRVTTTPPPVQPPKQEPPPKSSGNQPGPRVIPPEFYEYTVKRGETIESIAERELGSRRYASAIKRSNPGLSPDLMPAGRIILIPKDPTNIQGKVVEPAPSGPAAEASRPVEPPKASADAAKAGRTYTIKADDTLWGIAKQFYGKGSQYKLILDANKDKISDPNANLPVGMEIIIPDAR
jgi:nucleoid-associated protein YgaU